MQIKIKSDFELNDVARLYIEERAEQLEKLVSDTENTICDIEVKRTTGHQHGNVWQAEIRMTYPGGSLYTESSGESVNAAIDSAKDEMMSRLRKTKTKRFALVRRQGARIKNWMRFGRE